VLKPTTLAASRGVIRADDADGFAAAFRRTAAVAIDAGAATLDAEGRRWILVEDFLPGEEVALEGLLTDGVLRVLAVFDKPDPLLGPFFEETLYVTPSRLPPAALSAIAEETSRAAQALGLDHGPVHAELRWNAGRGTMVELAPRSIGGLCSRALRFTAGATLESLLLRHALGDRLLGVERESVASGVMMIPIPMAGTLTTVRGVEAARGIAGIEELRLTIPLGDTLVPLPEGSRYLGFLFARADTPERVEAALRAAHAELTFDIEPITVGTRMG
jgi:biotin carboxylase